MTNLIAIEPKKVRSVDYAFVNNGVVKLKVRSSDVVDIHVVNQNDKNKVKGRKSAQEFSIVSFVGTTWVDQIIHLPSTCLKGWRLAIGNLSKKSVAVEYEVLLP